MHSNVHAQVHSYRGTFIQRYIHAQEHISVVHSTPFIRLAYCISFTYISSDFLKPGRKEGGGGGFATTSLSSGPIPLKYCESVNWRGVICYYVTFLWINPFAVWWVRGEGEKEGGKLNTASLSSGTIPLQYNESEGEEKGAEGNSTLRHFSLDQSPWSMISQLLFLFRTS